MRVTTALCLSLILLPLRAEATEYPEAMRMVRIEPLPGKAGPVSWVLAADPKKVQVPSGMKATPVGGPYSSQEAVNDDYQNLGLLSVGDLPVTVRVYDSAGKLRPELQTLVRTATSGTLQGQYPADQELTNFQYKMGQNEGTPIPARPPKEGQADEPGVYRTSSMTGEVQVLRDTQWFSITPQNAAAFILRPGDRIYTSDNSSLVLQTADGPQRIGEGADVRVEGGGKFEVKNGSLESVDKPGAENISVETPTTEVGALGNP